MFAPAERAREPESIAPPAYVTESPEGKDRLISKMRHNLSSNKLYLQSLLEERDAKNQELVSANEEIQSANEELQSTNEELETTKEELQSRTKNSIPSMTSCRPATHSDSGEQRSLIIF